MGAVGFWRGAWVQISAPIKSRSPKPGSHRLERLAAERCRNKIATAASKIVNRVHPLRHVTFHCSPGNGNRRETTNTHTMASAVIAPDSKRSEEHTSELQ